MLSQYIVYEIMNVLYNLHIINKKHIICILTYIFKKKSLPLETARAETFLQVFFLRISYSFTQNILE